MLDLFFFSLPLSLFLSLSLSLSLFSLLCMCFYLSPAGPVAFFFELCITHNRNGFFSQASCCAFCPDWQGVRLLPRCMRVAAGVLSPSFSVRLCPGCVRVAAGSLSLFLSLSLSLSLSLLLLHPLCLAEKRKSGKAFLLRSLHLGERTFRPAGLLFCGLFVSPSSWTASKAFSGYSLRCTRRVRVGADCISLSLFLSLAHFASSSAGRFLLCLADNLFCSDFGTCLKLAPLISPLMPRDAPHPARPRSHHSLSLSTLLLWIARRYYVLP